MDPLIIETLYQEDVYNIPGKVMIIIGQAWDEVADEDKNQLTKILAALKLKPESVQILTRKSIKVEDLLPFAPSHIISFGVDFQPIVKSYESLNIDSIKFIYADALSVLDDIKKRNLWLALRVMFRI